MLGLFIVISYYRIIFQLTSIYSSRNPSLFLIKDGVLVEFDDLWY